MLSTRKGLILGLYGENGSATTNTKASAEYLAKAGDLQKQLPNILGEKFKQNTVRILYNQPGYDVLCFTNLGSTKQGFDELEGLDVGRESIRTSVYKSISALTELGVTHVDIDCCEDPEATAEGAMLSQFFYDDLKKEKKDRVVISPYNTLSDAALNEWRRGEVFAEAQNLSRWLMETPSNIMTPTRFAQVAQEKLGKVCAVTIRDKEWIKKENMNAFLAVTKGSEEPPVFLEVAYTGNKASPDTHVALVGKGITFDSGGISIKPSAKMDAMRADMGGAACSLAAVYAASKLNLPVNIRAYMPLCENMPSGTAIKPGDVVFSRSGQSVQIDNTDAEGRLILCDALHYACEKNPVCVIDSATLTGAMGVALGAGATGVFTNSTTLWEGLNASGQRTGDRVWRMPLYKLYKSHMSQAPLADLNNLSCQSPAAGACTAAAFLHTFVNCKHWAHLDIAGVMENSDQVPYLSKGMSGRPTRTLIDFLIRVNLTDYN